MIFSFITSEYILQAMRMMGRKEKRRKKKEKKEKKKRGRGGLPH
jgi:hypothetical protein